MDSSYTPTSWPEPHSLLSPQRQSQLRKMHAPMRTTPGLLSSRAHNSSCIRSPTFLCYSLLTTPSQCPQSYRDPHCLSQPALLLGEQGGRRQNHVSMEVDVLLSVCLHLLCALHDTPTMHSRTFPACRQINFPAHGGSGPVVCFSHLDHAGQMLRTDFFCHPGTGSTGSRPNPASLNSAAGAQQQYARCSWLAEGRPEDIPLAKAKCSLC